MAAFGRVKADLKAGNASALTTVDFKLMGEIVCGATSTEIALFDPSQFWFVTPR